jgi:hypothetical protein
VTHTILSPYFNVFGFNDLGLYLVVISGSFVLGNKKARHSGIAKKPVTGVSKEWGASPLSFILSFGDSGYLFQHFLRYWIYVKKCICLLIYTPLLLIPQKVLQNYYTEGELRYFYKEPRRLSFHRQGLK